MEFPRLFVAVDKIQNFLAQSLYEAYSSRMTRANPDDTIQASAAYAALRYGGAPPGAAQAQLALPISLASRLETMFSRRSGGGPDPMRPRFARHGAHVAAVLAAGGYPALKP
jgi:hypothetical protein